MLEHIKTYLKEGTRYDSLEICNDSDGEKFHVVQLERKEQELFVLREETFETLEAASTILGKGVPLFLIVNTTAVLTKIVSSTNDSNQEALVHQAFPNLDFTDFFYQIEKTGKNLLISISRKEPITTCLERLKTLKLPVFDISLGVSSATNVIGYLVETDFHISNARLKRSEAAILEIRPFSETSIESKAYTINGLKVSSKSLLGFSSILGHLVKAKGKRLGNLVEMNIVLKQEITNGRQFKLLLKSSLVGILMLLFVNFLVFDHYYDKVGALQETLALNEVNKDRLLQLKADVTTKEDRLNAVLAMANSNTSAFLDAIGKSLPPSLLLDEIAYQPLLKPLRESKPVALELGVLNVSGRAANSNEFYSWLGVLEAFSWVNKVETTDYDHNSGNSSDFSIKITLNEQ